MHRLYRGPDGIEFGIEPEITGAFPLVHFTQTWPRVQWQILGDDQRRSPDGTVAIRLEHNGFFGEIVMMQIGSTVHYPAYCLRLSSSPHQPP